MVDMCVWERDIEVVSAEGRDWKFWSCQGWQVFFFKIVVSFNKLISCFVEAFRWIKIHFVLINYLNLFMLRTYEMIGFVRIIDTILGTIWREVQCLEKCPKGRCCVMETITRKCIGTRHIIFKIIVWKCDVNCICKLHSWTTYLSPWTLSSDSDDPD